jgi:hypothetical protein
VLKTELNAISNFVAAARRIGICSGYNSKYIIGCYFKAARYSDN